MHTDKKTNTLFSEAVAVASYATEGRPLKKYVREVFYQDDLVTNA